LAAALVPRQEAVGHQDANENVTPRVGPNLWGSFNQTSGVHESMFSPDSLELRILLVGVDFKTTAG
jgi:hypothetical protein